MNKEKATWFEFSLFVGSVVMFLTAFIDIMFDFLSITPPLMIIAKILLGVSLMWVFKILSE